MQFIRSAVIVTCLIGSAACSRNLERSHVAAADPRTRSVTIENDNWLDVVVYVVRSGMRIRAGVVPGLSSGTLRLPRSIAPDDEVRFLLDPIGSAEKYLLEPVSAAPGQRIRLNVGSQLSLSTLAVWNP